MGFAHFIARRILIDNDRQDRLSRPIVTIAVLGIIIGMAVMILTVSITTGFQREIRAKVTGAEAHLQINSISQTDPKETPRVRIEQPFYPALDTVPGVAHIQVYATKPGIIETSDEIEGVIVKGVGSDHDWSFLQQHLVDGDILASKEPLRQPQVLISRYIGDRLHIHADDTITIYLVKGREDIRPRKFRVVGLYETGLEQIDHQLVYIDIAHLQRFSQWGLQAEIATLDSIPPEGLLIEGRAFGGDRVYDYEWPGTPWHGRGPHPICTDRDTLITLVVHDQSRTVPDTAWLRIEVQSTQLAHCARNDEVAFHLNTSGGSYDRYCGGFEVFLDRFEDVTRMDDEIYRHYLGVDLRSVSVRDRFPEIFAWLELLDANVVVVIALMVIVAIINMTSALLIIILERTPMIGTLKALGGGNGTIRRIFLIDAAYILGAGIVLGDLLGVGLCLLQQTFGIVHLPIATYYVDTVPVHLDAMAILLLNLRTLLVCVAAMVLPTLLVTRIEPARAIRFE